MSKPNRTLPIIVIALAVVGAAIALGLWYTSPTEQALHLARYQRPATGAGRAPLIGQDSLASAEALLKIASSRQEHWLVRDALSTADHSYDLAFSIALRDLHVHPPELNPQIKPYLAQVQKLEAQVKEQEQRADQFLELFQNSQGAKADAAATQLELANAELVLLQDQLEAAKRAVRRAGGDPAARLQDLFARHKAIYHNPQTAPPAPSQTAVDFQVPATVVAQLRLWQQLRNTRQQVQVARDQSVAAASALQARHQDLAAELQRLSASSKGGATPTTADLSALEVIAEGQKSLAEYDERMSDQQSLAGIYGDWLNLLADRLRANYHALLRSALWIFLIVVFVAASWTGVGSISQRLSADRRRRASLRLLGRLAVQVVGLVLILLVVLGTPGQLSTIIAFAGAGLTIALKSFIVAFFGWFVLMGKNGVRVGDWVEIDGISGEVVEIGIFRTVLLETGNWADTGHPTGRRVSFVNSYAIDGHYFNFSTTGQWLWDSLEILVPVGTDPYRLTDGVLKLVVKETEASARDAEQEWRRATHQFGVQGFSAAPVIDLRPAYQGVNMVVRYITRATERHELRKRLYERVVQLLHSQTGGGEANSPSLPPADPPAN